MMAERVMMPTVADSREMLTVTCVRLMGVRVAMEVMGAMAVMVAQSPFITKIPQI
jgi:hypothetical protein